MNYGVVYPQTELRQDPIAIRVYAQAAEGLGFFHTMGVGSNIAEGHTFATQRQAKAIGVE